MNFGFVFILFCTNRFRIRFRIRFWIRNSVPFTNGQTGAKVGASGMTIPNGLTGVLDQA